ncbi:MAG: hypothetical protein P1U56_17170 [Saprospiraceae bacterium]|nr:hypothetical protein [Saprospiraceae bacterium]
MILVNLEDIILNKRFGPVTLGSSMEQVIEFLGEPDSYSNPDVFPPNCVSIIYDWFEFTFYKGKLEMFHHKHILDFDYQYNPDFEYQNDRFKVTHWFNNFTVDLQINAIREWLKTKKELFTEGPFYDCIRIITDKQVELQFHSKLAYHLDPEEWGKLSNEDLNWQLGAFYIGNLEVMKLES